MEECWSALLNYWQEREFRHALTFPFFIGALRTTSNNTEADGRKEVEDLVNKMRSHRAKDYFHLVYRCPDLGQLVVRKVVNSLPPSSATPIPSEEPNAAPSLYVAEGLPLEGPSLAASLVATVWNETATAIENAQFSCRGKEFTTFNEYELRIIRSALA